MSEPFGARLAARVAERESQVVLGLDPDPARLWPEAMAARATGGGLFVLVRTSNPGAGDLQDRDLAGGGTVAERMAALVAQLGGDGDGLSDIGAVTGATVPEQLARLRELMPRAPFLL